MNKLRKLTFGKYKSLFKLLTCLLVVIMMSCSHMSESTPTENVKPDEQNRINILFQYEDGWVHQQVVLDVVKITYSGHSYIYFHNFNGNATTAAIVHDPDCECHNIASDDY